MKNLLGVFGIGGLAPRASEAEEGLLFLFAERVHLWRQRRTIHFAIPIFFLNIQR
jgi:hypothetical protein